MDTLLETEGTWDEVARTAGKFAGHRFRMTVIAPLPEKENRPIEDVFAEILADMPDEERAKLPADLAEQHDHYIYGWSRK